MSAYLAGTPKQQAAEVAFWKTYYSELVGARVVGVEIRVEDNEAWPVLRFVKNGESFDVDVSQDEEGNGPGFLFGLDSAPAQEAYAKAGGVVAGTR